MQRLRDVTRPGWTDAFLARCFYQASAYWQFGAADEYPTGRSRCFLCNRLVVEMTNSVPLDHLLMVQFAWSMVAADSRESTVVDGAALAGTVWARRAYHNFQGQALSSPNW